jgi:hypothetical protein
LAAVLTIAAVIIGSTIHIKSIGITAAVTIKPIIRIKDLIITGVMVIIIIRKSIKAAVFSPASLAAKGRV